MRTIHGGLAIALALAAASANAATFVFFTPPGTIDPSGEHQNGSASFETFADRDYIAVTLANYSAPLISIGQALTGVVFSATPNTIFTGVAVASGAEFSIDKARTVTQAGLKQTWYLQTGRT